MNELPWHCSACGHEQMVDFECLSVWPIDRIRSAKGYVCQGCGHREAILITTTSLEEAMRKLKQIPPGHRNFKHQLAKCIKKAEGLHSKVETETR